VAAMITERKEFDIKINLIKNTLNDVGFIFIFVETFDD
jgi:hypothetical protein